MEDIRITDGDPLALKYFHQVRYVTDYNPNWRPTDEYAYRLTLWVKDEADSEWRHPANLFERRKAIREVNALNRRLEEAQNRLYDDFELDLRFPYRKGPGFDMGDFE